MSVNKDIKFALKYHDATKHSEASLMTSRHYLDFDNKPIPFKVYPELPSIALPTSFPTPEVNALSCIASNLDQLPSGAGRATETKMKPPEDNAASPRSVSKLDAGDLAELLFFSAGITRVVKYPYGSYYMRAASATGALYPIELYVVCDDISSDLKAGVYHYSPADFSLTQIRKGTYKRYLATMADNQDILNSPITVIFTSLAWRNAWKYQARSYRHWFWDAGVIIANLLATSIAIGFASRVITGFVDDSVDHLLRLEDKKEASIAMVAIGIGLSGNGENPNQQQELLQAERYTIEDKPIPKIRPLSKKGEISYPEIWKLNGASKLNNREEVSDWINNSLNSEYLLERKLQPSQRQIAKHVQDNIAPTYPQEDIKHSFNLKETILWRGSSRSFARSQIALSVLNNILYCSTRGVPMDIFNEGTSLIDIYFIANAVDGLNPGGYYYNRQGGRDPNSSFNRIKDVAYSRKLSAYLCLGQSLFGDASAVLFLMADLQSVLRSLGNRGYRACQLEAGIIAGKIYLAAYAQRTGASGSTFFDDAVTEFFSPHATNKSTMIAVGVGVPGYNARPGKILPLRLSKEQLLTYDFT
ncbi:MAG: SagB/ThcOx family dehydrogenase [Thermoproteota archaeon]|nr:SagB/ThcOx family dehydrogenase [Thermoproteota archaeon]